MAIDLQKLEQKFNALIEDENFVTDFEQWLEARIVSQNSSKPFVIRSFCPDCNYDKHCELQENGKTQKNCRCFTVK